MKNKIFCVVVILILTTCCLFACKGNELEPLADYIDVSINQDALFRIACITDCHSRDNHLSKMEIRPDVYTTLNAYSRMNVDVLLVGGDLASGRVLSEDKNNILLDKYNSEFKKVTNKVLWVTGNHDYSTAHNTYPSSNFSQSRFDSLYYEYNSADYYNKFMKDNQALGNVINLYKEEYNNRGHNNSAKGEYVLGYHYKISDYHFVGINTHPGDLIAEKQRSNYRYTDGTREWVINELSSISTDKPIFLLAHVPLNDSKGLRKNKGVLDYESMDFAEELSSFSNLIYLYGHDHNIGKDANGEDTLCYIREDVFERVTQYKNANDEIAFTSCFMGSMSYDCFEDYNTATVDPPVVQGLIVEVFKDKVVLTMKNFGIQNGGAFKPKSFEIKIA